MNSAWISLDENDDDPRIFLLYFVTAIQSVYPEACKNILSIVNASQLPPVDYLTNKLINELTVIPENIILALDDYHFIQDQAIHQMLAILIHNIPPQIHLMIATRKDPPLPIHLLRGRNQMLEIRAVDLRFTIEEAREYFEHIHGEELDLNAVSSLTKSAEGWITGLRLAALSLRGQEDLRASVGILEGSSTFFYVREYLFNEVLSRQSQDIQDFLIKTSILDHFCSELCDAVIDGSTSHILLEKLSKPNLFLINLDMEHKWYRYHHLFQDLLRHRLKRTYSQEEVYKLHHRASNWFENNNMIEEALNHAIASEDMDTAVQLIEVFRHDLLNAEDWYTLERWLNRLTDVSVQTQPELLLARAWTMQLRYQIDMIPPILLEVEILLSADNKNWTDAQLLVIRGEIDALKSFLYYTNDECAQALASSLSALECIPLDHTFVRSIAIIIMALAYHGTGQSKLGLKKLNTFLAETHSELIVARVLIGQTYIHMMRGDLHKAEHVLNQLQSLTDEASLPISKIVARWLLGKINYERNNLDAARKFFLGVFELRYSAQFIHVHDSMLTLAMIEHVQGLPENGARVIADLRKFSHEREIIWKLHEIDSAEARLALHSGNEELAIQLVQSISSDILPTMLVFLEIPIITKAQVLIRQGTDYSINEAILLLEELLAYVDKMHITYHKIRILACLALAYQANGRNKDAKNALESSLKLAHPGVFIRTYVDLGQDIIDLLKQLSDQGVEIDYILKILAAFPGQDQIGEKQRSRKALANNEIIEPLTRREHEVLEFLGKWLSDKEIAKELVISPRTVKKHNGNIYAKLGVQDRMRAVEKAKELGLL